MTPSQRTIAIGAPIGAVVFVTYWVIVFVRAANDDLPFTQVAWQGPMLLTLGVGAGVYVIGAAISWRATREDRFVDQRDRDISRYGGSVDAQLTGLAVLACLIMLALDVDTFWVANVLLTGSFLGSIASAGAQLAAYRDGIPA